jgi:hypothetical protein
MDTRYLCTALLTAAFATVGFAQEGDDADASREPRSCLNQAEIRRATILNDRNIVFVTRFEKIYSNQLPKQCPGLNRKSLVNYPIAGGRSCAGDRFQVLVQQQPGSYWPTTMCPLGVFVPITEAELEDLVAMTEEDPARRRRGRSSREAVTTEQVELPPAATRPDAEPTAGE